MDRRDLPHEDGWYSAKLRDGDYCLQRENGWWYFADGTGWREPMDPREIVEISPREKP